MCDKQSKGRASRVLSRSDSDVICTQLSKGMKRRPKTQAQQRGAKSWSMHAPGGLPGEAERKRFLSMITRTGRSIWSIDRTPLSWLKNSSSSWHMPATPPCLLLLLCSKSKAKEREPDTNALSLIFGSLSLLIFARGLIKQSCASATSTPCGHTPFSPTTGRQALHDEHPLGLCPLMTMMREV
jgi:hypothetical protein